MFPPGGGVFDIQGKIDILQKISNFHFARIFHLCNKILNFEFLIKEQKSKKMRFLYLFSPVLRLFGAACAL